MGIFDSLKSIVKKEAEERKAEATSTPRAELQAQPEAKDMAVDNNGLQISIERYLKTGSELGLDIIIDAVEYKHELDAALYKK
ncbi:hypothetical protein KAU11_05850 [Candidatus Babeliales bacterium]|nr:hypothetical protein [Candidatus Babeliales bacterium]